MTAGERAGALAVLVLLAGGLLALGYATHPYWWAAWLAPAPALAAVLLAPRRLRWAVGGAVGLVAGGSGFAYYVTTGSVAAAVAVTAAYALGWSGALRLAAAVADRWHTAAAAGVVPVVWAAIDTLLVHASPHGSVGSLAYSQAGVLPVLQVASLGGMPAVTFLLLLPGSVAGVALAYWFGPRLGHPHGRQDVRPRHLPHAVGGAAVVVGATLTFGWARLGAAPVPAGGAVTGAVTMVASDRPAAGGRGWARFLADYGAALDRAARPGATVLLPEAVLRVDSAGARRAADTLTAHAGARRATLVVGVVVDAGGVRTNRALVALPDGRHTWYLKQHLVPGLERDLTPGGRRLLVGAPAPGTGVAICKDMHFPTLGRAYARDGARLLLVPANDFGVDDRMMMAVAAIRGIEGGFAVARAARGGGMSAVSDPYGRVLAERRTGPATGTLTARLPAGLDAPTIYARIGDLFGWTCVAAWLTLAVTTRSAAVRTALRAVLARATAGRGRRPRPAPPALAG